MTWPVFRGQVIQADIGLDEPKLLVVVSNNRRNKRLDDVLAVRMTTSKKPRIASIVPLPHSEAVAGSVVCDDVIAVYEGEVLAVRTALSRSTMAAVDDGLRAALDL